MRGSGGHLVEVTDEQVRQAQRALAHQGILVEPAGATAYAGALADAAAGRIGPDERVVAVATGAGYKDSAALARIGTAMTSPAFYAYDKGGMVNLTRYLACFYGPRGVRVNCLSPGGLRGDGQAEPFLAAYRRATPLGRLAGPSDIKGPVVFLASDASAYVTGANLMVDGGWTAH